eukprot:TRINITY_DN93868_c0_g1_i1.p1 TRINITY_DN93868_c0_g1~~TRINITY_DN93868_c0_g1_i1.p1  ORF type:complete len:614 (-),score=107.27 TRINITY_DN93868_c0_g1_i1:307-2148(-)
MTHPATMPFQETICMSRPAGSFSSCIPATSVSSSAGRGFDSGCFVAISACSGGASPCGGVGQGAWGGDGVSSYGSAGGVSACVGGARSFSGGIDAYGGVGGDLHGCSPGIGRVISDRGNRTTQGLSSSAGRFPPSMHQMWCPMPSPMMPPVARAASGYPSAPCSIGLNVDRAFNGCGDSSVAGSFAGYGVDSGQQRDTRPDAASSVASNVASFMEESLPQVMMNMVMCPDAGMSSHRTSIAQVPGSNDGNDLDHRDLAKDDRDFSGDDDDHGIGRGLLLSNVNSSLSKGRLDRDSFEWPDTDDDDEIFYDHRHREAVLSPKAKAVANVPACIQKHVGMGTAPEPAERNFLKQRCYLPPATDEAILIGSTLPDKAAVSAVDVSIAKNLPTLLPRPDSLEKTPPTDRVLNKTATTTWMIKHLPITLSQQDFLEALNQSGFAGRYDFCYIPRGFENELGLGYGFVNFISPQDAEEFRASWQGKAKFVDTSDGGCQPRRLLIKRADVQGYAANIAQWEKPRERRRRNPALKPYVANWALTNSAHADCQKYTSADVMPPRESAKKPCKAVLPEPGIQLGSGTEKLALQKARALAKQSVSDEGKTAYSSGVPAVPGLLP